MIKKTYNQLIIITLCLKNNNVTKDTVKDDYNES